MITGPAARLFLAVVVVLGNFAGNSFAADKAKALGANSGDIHDKESQGERWRFSLINLD